MAHVFRGSPKGCAVEGIDMMMSMIKTNRAQSQVVKTSVKKYL